MATIKAEFGTSSLTCFFLDFMEQVLPLAKAIEQNLPDPYGHDWPRTPFANLYAFVLDLE